MAHKPTSEHGPEADYFVIDRLLLSDCHRAGLDALRQAFVPLPELLQPDSSPSERPDCAKRSPKQLSHGIPDRYQDAKHCRSDKVYR